MQKSFYTPPACMMVSLRDVRIANTSGHIIIMEANVPQSIPGPLVDTAASLGCVPVDAKEYEDHKTRLAKTVTAEKERDAKLIDAVDRLVRRNDIKEFTPTGQPKISALAAEAGIPESELTQHLRDHVFSEWSTRNRLASQTPVQAVETKKGK